ncbi:hypothetical protein DFH08DRAFT_839095 [Mycena albidolilacea]|uniref:Secreted protein n=1 Tax=Mycena albidolilacea TaxID=1033008 RepID=A0AAD7AP74_9AGAR|nr:hypothetical protein DFH08DRAFT_839095 [Mycena albidolilacea]
MFSASTCISLALIVLSVPALCAPANFQPRAPLCLPHPPRVRRVSSFSRYKQLDIHLKCSSNLETPCAFPTHRGGG